MPTGLSTPPARALLFGGPVSESGAPLFVSEPEQKQAQALAGRAETLCQLHEDMEHGGEVCMQQRAGTVAFLAHRLGVRGTQAVILFLDALVLYEEEHERTHVEGGR